MNRSALQPRVRGAKVSQRQRNVKWPRELRPKLQTGNYTRSAALPGSTVARDAGRTIGSAGAAFSILGAVGIVAGAVRTSVVALSVRPEE